MPRHVPARIYRRVPFETAVRLEFDRFHGFVEQYSANLSLGGMFIVSDEPPAPGTELAVEFRLGDGFELIRGRGRVMWVRDAGGDGDPAGFGLRFLELTPGSRELIFRLVERRVREGDRVFDLDEGAPARPETSGAGAAGEDLAAPPWELPPPRAEEEAGTAARTAAAAATIATASRFGRAARELPEPPIEHPAPAPPAADPEVSFAGLVDDDATVEASPLVDEDAVDPASAAWSAVRSLESGGGAAGAPALSPAGEEGRPGGEAAASPAWGSAEGEATAIGSFGEREDEAGASLGASTTAGFDRDDVRMRWNEAGGEVLAWGTAGSRETPFVARGADVAPGGEDLGGRGAAGSGATPLDGDGAGAAAVGEGSTARTASPLAETEGELAVPPGLGMSGSAAGPFGDHGADTAAGGGLSRGDEAVEAPGPGSAGPVAAGFDDAETAWSGSAGSLGATAGGAEGWAVDAAGAAASDVSAVTGAGTPADGTEGPAADSPWPWASPLPEAAGASPSSPAQAFGAEPEKPARPRGGRVAVAAAAAGIAAVAVAGSLWLGRGDESKAAVAAPPAAQRAPVTAEDDAVPPLRSVAADSAAAAAPPRPSAAAASAATPPPAATRPGTIESIAWQRRAGGVDFEIAGAGPIPAAAVGHFTVGGERPRLVVEIGGVERPYARSEIAVGEGPVERVRTGFHPVAGSDAGELRIVFDLAAPAEATVETAGGRVRVRFGGG